MTDAVPLEIGVTDLERWRQGAEAPAILDVREPWEVAICGFPEALHIPLAALPDQLDRVPDDRPVVVVCHHGMRSLQAVRWLRAQGRDQAINLAGGVDAWARTVDPAMPTY